MCNKANENSNIMTVHNLVVYMKMSDVNIYRMVRAEILPVIHIGKIWCLKKNGTGAWPRNHASTNLEIT